ncbi:MAG TPA: class I SAM-dependent methyltransferase [Gammaproteobacteria bacterium]|nr:class I SAM-dependent methyltransferase [Gammaproteobacteria bacterium]
MRRKSSEVQLKMSRKDLWENIYADKSPTGVSWYQKEPATSLSLIRNLPLERDVNIIDVGGGASTLVDYLLEDGFKNITVLDLSSNALALARKRLGEKADLINWKTEDITSYVPGHDYSLWHDRAVFHFLTEKGDREKYKKVLESSIRNGGFVIIAAFSMDGPRRCSGFDIVQYDAEKLQNELGGSFKLVKELPEKHITPAGKEQLFGYYVFTKSA